MGQDRKLKNITNKQCSIGKNAAAKRRRRRKTRLQSSKEKKKQQLVPVSLQAVCEQIRQREVVAATEILKEGRNKETVVELALNACSFASYVTPEEIKNSENRRRQGYSCVIS